MKDNERKKMIFHVPFPLEENPSSASGLRPVKMINAFRIIGYDVDIVSGYVVERKKKIIEILRNLKNGVKYDLCYSESSTMPTALTEKHHFPVAPFLDFSFFKKLKGNSIPIALFYRDVYWNFDLYSKTPAHKRIPAEFFYKYDLKMYNRFVDLFLLPSTKMLDYIPVPITVSKISPLPPGCEIINLEKKRNVNSKNLLLLYVGGITPPLYDLTPLIKNIQTNQTVSLKIVCRKEEYEKTEDYYNIKNSSNITITHGKGNVVKECFLDADIFSIVRSKDEYLSFAMPYKLFEAISYELPILTNKGTAVSDFVEKYDIGWAIDNNDINFLKNLSENVYLIQEKIANIKKIKGQNTWESRALFVVDKLLR